MRKAIYTLRKRPNPKFLLERLKNKKKRTDIQAYFKKLFPNSYIKAKFHFIEHHKSHLASAFYASNFKKSAVFLLMDLEIFKFSLGLGNNKELKIDGQNIFLIHWGFYTAITQFLGFPNYGDEYKVMGLAPYGKTCYMEEMREIIKIQSDELNKFKIL